MQNNDEYVFSEYTFKGFYRFRGPNGVPILDRNIKHRASMEKLIEHDKLLTIAQKMFNEDLIDKRTLSRFKLNVESASRLFTGANSFNQIGLELFDKWIIVKNKIEIIYESK